LKSTENKQWHTLKYLVMKKCNMNEKQPILNDTEKEVKKQEKDITPEDEKALSKIRDFIKSHSKDVDYDKPPK
jgi:hypothetical protein